MPKSIENPWFAGRPGRLFVYRVNRRPHFAETLFPTDMPEDVFDHFVRMLTPGYPVTTGRANQRVWRVGGVRIVLAERVLTGKLGWQPREEEVVWEWSEDAKDWTSSTAAPKERKLMPLGFDGDSRLLTVLSDGASAPATIAAVFEKILRSNEKELPEPTTEWSVEPVLDRQDFLSWLEGVDVVTQVSFTAKLPNPEPMDDFRNLYERLQRTHATRHTETMRSNREEGLVEVEDDPDFKQAIAMGQEGFATLRGKGHRDGSLTTYSQTEAVATETVDELPMTWDEMRDAIKRFLKGSLRRFKDAA